MSYRSWPFSQKTASKPQITMVPISFFCTVAIKCNVYVEDPYLVKIIPI